MAKIKTKRECNALNTTEEVQQRRPQIAILPIGATEQHGAHLPLATDSIVIEAVARRVAGELGAYCLPTLPFSISHMHRGQPGTVWLRNETFRQVIRDLAISLRYDGIQQLILLNGHGGNLILPAIVQDLNLEFPDLLTIVLTPPDFGQASGAFEYQGSWGHADEYETSMILHLHQELVRVDKLRDQSIEPDRELLLYMPFKKFAKLTFTGTPTKATAEKGRRALDFIVAQTVQHLRATLKKTSRSQSRRQ